MDSSVLTSVILGELRERKQKRKFNFLLALFLAIVAMTAIIVTPIVQTFVSKKTAVVAEWTDGLTPQAFGTETWAGTGSEADAFQIATATDLAQLACNVNAGTTYEGMYFTLTSELNLAGREWTPIGTMEHPFMGTFDGAQKAIYFMTMTGDKYDYYGLFGVVKETLITKVDMRNSYINVGGLATGGIIGYAENASVSYSTNGSEDIEKMGFPTNDLTEYSTNSVSSIETWFNKAQKRGVLDETSNERVGGNTKEIISERNKDKSKNGLTHGTGTVTSSTADCGGIVGYLRQNGSGHTQLYSCWNQGNVKATNSSRAAGGIVGYAHSDTVCGNSGSAAHLAINKCANVSTVNSACDAGGVVGYAKSEGSGDWLNDYDASIYIIESYTVGTVSSSNSSKAGSILGFESRNANMSHAFVHIGGAEGGANPYCYWLDTGINKSYGSNAVDKENAQSTSSLALSSWTRFCSGYGNGWTDGNWIPYDASSITSGTTITTTQLYISPSGATKWTKKSSTPYNYYEKTTTLPTYTVTFNMNGGSGGTTSASVISGNKIGSITKPSQTNCTFQGYYDSTSGGTQYVNSSGSGVKEITESIILYAQWVGNSVSIRFYVNNTYLKATTSKYLSTYGAGGWPTSTDVNTYAPTGWYASGYWYTDYSTENGVKYGSGSSVSSGSTIPTSSSSIIKLYAGLIANEITISASGNGGSVSDWTSKSIIEGSSIGDLPTATRTGYTFGDWWTESTNGNRVYTNTTFSSSTTIYAHWTPNTYTVILDKQGGSGGSDSVTATYNETLPSANAPSKFGYVFNGYYTEENGKGLEYYSSTMKTSRIWTLTTDTRLYAYWTAGTVTITYDSQKGTSVSDKTIKFGEKLTNTQLPSSTRTGYTLDGWYSSSYSGKLTTDVEMNDSNFDITGLVGSLETRVYAQWTPKTPKVTLSATDADGYSSTWTDVSSWSSSASTKTASKTCTYDQTIGTMPVPTRKGWRFKGWFDGTSSSAKEYTDTSVVDFESEKKLYAQWKQESYTLTISPFGGLYNGSTNSITIPNKHYKDTITLSTVTRTGYTFVEWRPTNSGTVTKSGSNYVYTFDAGDDTIVAQWKANEYRLTFDIGEGEQWGTIDSAIFTQSGNTYYKTVTYDAKISTMPEPTKEGYNFLGWYESVSSQSRWTPDTGYTVAGNTTLIARFSANPYTLTIVYDNTLGTQTQGGTIGQTITLASGSDLTRKGYTFIEYELIDGVGELSGFTFKFGAGNAILKVKWENNKYKVKYDSNGGSGEMETSEFTYDVDGTLSKNTFEKTGYKFVNWNTNANGTGASYIDQSAISNLTSKADEVLTMYAQWEPIKYNIAFDGNGGVIQPTEGFKGTTGGKFSTHTYNYNEELGVLPNVELAGHTFSGWFYENTFDTEVKSTDKATKDCTIYAKLTANQYTLQLNAGMGKLSALSGWEIDSNNNTAIKLITYGTAIGQMPEPTLTGNNFKGWYDKADSTGTLFAPSSVFNFADTKILYAHYQAQNMTVFFDPAGGSVTTSQLTRSYNSTIGTFPSATRAGYDFVCWYYNGTNTQANTTDYVTETVTLVAKWKAKTFILTFNANGGVFESGTTFSKNVTFNEEIGTFPEIQKVGADYIGWFENFDGTGTQYLPTTLVQFTENKIIYAHFEVATFQVIFNAGGGTCSLSSKKYEYDEQYGELPTPSYTGYKFLGWSLDAESTTYVKATDTVTQVHTLYAQYKPNTYYIVFDKNRSDAVGTEMQKMTVTYGTGVNLSQNTYSSPSAIFAGWSLDNKGNGDKYSDEQIVYNLSSNDGEEVRLYALWTDNTYWVVVDTLNVDVVNANEYSQYGSFALNKVYTHNQKIGVLPQLAKRGHNFVGFKDENGNSVNENTLVTSDMRLISQWEAMTITYTFDADGGTFTSVGSGEMNGNTVVITSKYGEQISTLPTVEKVGYSFKYFVDKDNSNYAIFDGITITTESDVYAIASWQAQTYVVVFSAGAGTIDADGNFVGGQSTESAYVEYDGTFGVLPTATLRGNTFKGWWTEQNMSGTKIEPTTVFKNTFPTTLYAGWQVSRYDVTILANGGNFGSSGDITKKITGDFGSTIELQIPTRVGYDFDGFEKTSTLDDGVASNSSGVWRFTFGLGNATLSAKWKGIAITITFDCGEDGATALNGELPTKRIVYYDKEYGSFAVLKKDGKTFAGWARADGTSVNGTDIVKDTSDFTLYAQWTTDEYRLSINPNGGTYDGKASNTTLTGALGDTETILTPTRVGHTFAGWTEAFIGQDGTTTYVGLNDSTYTFGNGNGSLTAKWNAITYTIKFVDGVDGAVGTPYTQDITYGSTVALTKNTFTRAGYDFTNWLWGDRIFTDTELVTNLSSTAGDVITLSAQWTEKSYNLTIDPNGGVYSGITAGTKITKLFGQTYIISTSNLPTFRGRKFVGFSDSANLVGSVESGYTYTFNSYDETIVAQWEIITIEVTLCIHTGASWTADAITKYKVSDNVGHITATFGQRYDLIPIKDDIIYAGYEFKGFYTESKQYIDSSSIVDFESDITLTAEYNESGYVLTIDPNGGEFRNSSATQMFDGKINDVFTLDKPTRKGYTFVSWTQSGRGTLADDQSQFTFVDDNCKLTAQWKENEYTIQFNKNVTNLDEVSGTMTDLSCKYDLGGRLTKNNYTRAGYTFVGWARVSDGSVEYVDNAYFINLTADNGGVVVLYAQWQIIEYTITFDANGGQLSSPYQKRNYGTEYGSFPKATKTGYTLLGWFTDTDTEIKSSDIVRGDITLYAHWQANTYTITFKAGDGRIIAGADGYAGEVGGNETSITVTFDGLYSGMPEAEHDSKLFAGWFTSEQADGLQIFNTTTVTVAGAQTLYAHWASDQYNVSFDANGGNVGEHTRRVNHGEKYGELPVPTYVGYDFDGWFFEDTNDEITGDSEVTHKGDHTLRAHWTPKKFTVTFEYDGGTFEQTPGYDGDGTTKVVTYDDTFGVLPTAVKTGKRTLGWFDADDKLVDKDKIVKILSDITLKAKYDDIPYSLVIELDGGMYEDLRQVQQFSGIYNQTIDLAVPTKSGYKFAGYENRLGVGSVVKDGDIYKFTFGAGDTTLYAVWEPIEIVVTFYAQDGELSGSSISISDDKKKGIRRYKFGEKFSTASVLPIAKLAGYKFDGWFTEENGGYQMTDAMIISIPNDFNLYARYEALQYVLTIDPQGGVFAGSTRTYDFKDKVVGAEITFDTPTRVGYRFTGFVMTGDGELEAQNAQLTQYKFIFKSSSATLTAQWENEKYNVLFDYDGADGGNTVTTLEVTYDELYRTLPTPTKSGYDFVGWFTEKENGTKVDNTTTVKTASNHILYARWELHKYKLQVLLTGGKIDNVEMTDKEFENYFGEIVNFSIPTRYGYTFDGFERTGDKGELNVDIENNVVTFKFGNGNCKLVAKWKNKDVVVNFDYDDATSGNTPASKTIKFDEEYGKLPTPEKAGYDFVGWFDSREIESRVLIIPSVLVKKAETHTLYAVFNEITTSLTIILDGGELALEKNPIEKPFGETFTFAKPTKTGFEFVKYTSSDAGALVNNNDGTWTYTFGLINAVVTAHWTAQTIAVEFSISSDAELDGATIDWTGVDHTGNAIKAVFGEKYGTLPNVSRYGWKFKGWFTEQDGGGERIIDTSTVSRPNAHTLYAHFEQDSYNLTINLNGGTADGQELKIEKHAKDVVTLIAPTKTGYTFVGYSIVSGNIEQDSGDKLKFTFLESDATIIADYTAKKYTLTFNANGDNSNPATIPYVENGEWSVGDSNTFATKEVTFGGKIGAMPTPIRDGFKFYGWTKSGTANDDVYTPLTYYEFDQNLTLNAVWSSNEFILTIDLDGGKLTETGKTVVSIQGTNGMEYTIDSTPIRVGYTFVDFNVEYAISGQGNFEQVGTSWKFTFGSGNATITALWTPIEIKVTLDANGAKFDESTLNGWSLSADKLSATKTFKYKDLLGTIYNDDTTTSFGALPQISLAGNDFKGWFVDGTQYSETSPVEWLADVILTASFGKGSYSLIINTDGGLYSDDEFTNQSGVLTITQEYGTTRKITTPTKVGHKFSHWEGEGYGDFNTDTNIYTFGAGMYTLVATYTPITYTIKFDENGGTGSMDPQTFIYGKSAVLSNNAFTRDGFNFVRWDTSPSGDGTSYANMGMILNETTIDGDEIILYAVWTSAWITMYFDANNGTADPVGISVQYGKEFGTLPRVERKGYNFGGWYESIVDDVPVGTAIETTTICTYFESQTFIAFWTIANYTVTLPSGYSADSMILTVFDAYKDTLNENKSQATIVYNHDFAFQIEILEAYSLSQIKVYATSVTQGKKEILAINGAYMLTQIADNIVITIENLNKNTYTVLFDACDGLFGNSQYTTVKVEWGEKITKPTRPTRLHYDFIGWYANKNSTNEFDFAKYKVYSDVVLYAKYQKAHYAINFYVDDQLYRRDMVEYESVVAKPSNPTKAGYNFVGWRLSNGTMYSFTSQVVGELNLYAEFDTNTYKVRFYNGERLLDTINVRFGEKVTVNFGSGITGYTLDGWYADANFKTLFDFDSAITGDTNIFGKYDLNYFTVDFYVNGQLQASQQVGYRYRATAPTDITLEAGYHIEQWFTDIDLTHIYDFVNPITSDLVLFGKVERDKFYVTFIANGQKILREVYYGDTLDELPQVPARIGYDQVEPYWEEVDLTNITAPITVNAVYTINKYTVTIVMPDGSRIYKEVEYGKTLTDLPKIDTKFGDRVIYDQDISNITSNLIVYVEVKNYIFWPLVIVGSILAILIVVYIVYVIIKTRNKRGSRDKIKELINTRGK